MKKADIIRELIDFSRYNSVVDEFISRGFANDVAKEKAVSWYCKHYTKEELDDMYFACFGARI